MTDEHVLTKHPVLSLLGGALGGGFVGGFLWFFLDNIVRINGQGWLQRLPWPAPGLAYAPTATMDHLGMAGSAIFPHWSSGAHRSHGTHRGLPVEVVDVTELHESTDSEGSTSRTTTRRTVVLLPGEGLPDFDLGPRRLRHRVLGAMGVAGVAFDAAGVPTAHQAEVVGRFARSWHLAASDP